MNRRLAAFALVALIGIAGLGIWWAASPHPATPSGPPEAITVAYSPFESSCLFLVADDRQFFAGNGLNLTLHRSVSGAAALDDMLAGKGDLAVSVSEFPLVREVFQGTPVRAVASIDRAEYIYVVARKDRGIENPQDLEEKRIGTASGSIAEFYLGRFLSVHGLGMRDIRYVDVKTPSETSNAVVDGDLDAAVLAQPYADAARDRLGANAVVWPAQMDQPLYALVVATDGWLEAHPEAARRFLASLADAEAYLLTHPAESRAILRQRLDLDPEYMDTVWEQNRYSLSLDQSLIAAMEDEARWMIANNMTNATAIPDFREYVDTTALEQVRPDAVRIIG